MARVSELIDTTEMYLRTVYELEEEGIVPLLARHGETAEIDAEAAGHIFVTA